MAAACAVRCVAEVRECDGRRPAGRPSVPATVSAWRHGVSVVVSVPWRRACCRVRRGASWIRGGDGAGGRWRATVSAWRRRRRAFGSPFQSPALPTWHSQHAVQIAGRHVRPMPSAWRLLGLPHVFEHQTDDLLELGEVGVAALGSLRVPLGRLGVFRLRIVRCPMRRTSRRRRRGRSGRHRGRSAWHSSLRQGATIPSRANGTMALGRVV